MMCVLFGTMRAPVWRLMLERPKYLTLVPPTPFCAELSPLAFALEAGRRHLHQRPSQPNARDCAALGPRQMPAQWPYAFIGAGARLVEPGLLLV